MQKSNAFFNSDYFSNLKYFSFFLLKDEKRKNTSAFCDKKKCIYRYLINGREVLLTIDHR